MTEEATLQTPAVRKGAVVHIICGGRRTRYMSQEDRPAGWESLKAVRRNPSMPSGWECADIMLTSADEAVEVYN